VEAGLITQRQVHGGTHPNTVRSNHVLVSVLVAQGERERAERICREALEAVERERGAEDREAQGLREHLADVRDQE